MIRCVQQSYRYLSRRPHLEKELHRKLTQKSFKADIIKRAFDYLRKKSYLDDRKFICSMITEESKKKRSGPLLIRKKLLQKGARVEDIEDLINTEYRADLEIENLRNLMTMKYKKLAEQEPGIRMQKTVRFLQQRGYAWETIQSVMVEENLTPGEN